MKLEEVKTAKGILKYRNPTVIETISLVKMLREYFATDDTIGAKLAIMEKLKDFLDYSDLEGIKNFEELNEHGEEMTSALFEISDTILNKVVAAFAKKA
jgi:hypothetical protein